MEITQSKIEGVFEIQPKIFKDDRGYFLESYNQKKLEDYLPISTFVQDNTSFSKKDVIRGLHFQRGEYAQDKLVKVLHGKALDVVVDIRPGSSTFGQHETFLLDAEQHNMVFVPAGLAHGFSALEDVYFYYKCSAYYNPATEGGIIYNDADLAINWRVENPVLSEKDLALETFSSI